MTKSFKARVETRDRKTGDLTWELLKGLSLVWGGLIFTYVLNFAQPDVPASDNERANPSQVATQGVVTQDVLASTTPND